MYIERLRTLVLEVGQPMDPPIPFPGNGTHYNYNKYGHWFIVMLDIPTPEEVHQITSDPVKFGIYEYEGVIFFLAKFGDLPWNDAPYSALRLSEEERPDTRTIEGQHAAIQVILVDSRTNLIKGLRIVTLSPELTKLIDQKAAEQLENPHWASHYDSTIDKAYAKFSPSDMADRCIARCFGGD